MAASWAEYTTMMGEAEVCEVQSTEALGRPDTVTYASTHVIIWYQLRVS